MGNSLTTQIGDASGHFTHKASGSVFTIYRDPNGGVRHRLEERGLTADYPIAYSIGHGIVGRSFMIDLNGHLFQSPASFYVTHGWDVSPGYQDAHMLDFDRAPAADCWVCHADSVQQKPHAVKLTPLSCDRCHGPADSHLKNPVPGTIINPAKLPVRERDSVCEQCHLEGATTVLNPGKNWSDFHPGLPLEAVETHYVFRNADGTLRSMPAVSHSEQLAVSACFRGSGGKLWCGTCHDPHGPATKRVSQIKQICTSCHTPTQLAAKHSPGQDDCAACHMPRRDASDVIHAAITDHRILKRPISAMPDPGGVLAAWQPPSPQIADRNLGLAWFHVARRTNSGPAFERSYDILSKQTHTNDAEVSATLGYMLLGSGHSQQSLTMFKAAVNCQPDNSEYWLDLGVAQQAAGDTQGAITSLTRSMNLAPYSSRSYQALSNLYRTENQPALARQVLQEFLKLVPQSLTIRLLE